MLDEGIHTVFLAPPPPRFSIKKKKKKIDLTLSVPLNAALNFLYNGLFFFFCIFVCAYLGQYRKLFLSRTIKGWIQDFVLGGHIRMGMGACPSELARVSGKAQ